MDIVCWPKFSVSATIKNSSLITSRPTLVPPLGNPLWDKLDVTGCHFSSPSQFSYLYSRLQGVRKILPGPFICTAIYSYFFSLVFNPIEPSEVLSVRSKVTVRV